MKFTSHPQTRFGSQTGLPWVSFELTACTHWLALSILETLLWNCFLDTDRTQGLCAQSRRHKSKRRRQEIAGSRLISSKLRKPLGVPGRPRSGRAVPLRFKTCGPNFLPSKICRAQSATLAIYHTRVMNLVNCSWLRGEKYGSLGPKSSDRGSNPREAFQAGTAKHKQAGTGSQV